MLRLLRSQSPRAMVELAAAIAVSIVSLRSVAVPSFLAAWSTTQQPLVSHPAGQKQRPATHAMDATLSKAAEDSASLAARGSQGLMAIACAAAVGWSLVRSRRGSHQRLSLRPGRLQLCSLRAAGDVEAAEEDETEKLFKDAYEAEEERAKLLKEQLQKEVAATMGGMMVTVSDPTVATPLTSGSTTWREAFQAMKQKAAELEDQVQKTRGLKSTGSADAAPEEEAPKVAAPAQTSTEVRAEPVPTRRREEEELAKDDSFLSNLLGEGASKQDKLLYKSLEELSEKDLEDESTIRLLAAPLISPKEVTTQLPDLGMLKQTVGTDQFFIRETVVLSRSCVFKGTVASGVTPAQAMETLRGRLKATCGDKIELLLQPSKQGGTQALLCVLLQEDLGFDEFAWWQYVLNAACLIFTVLTVNITPFVVTTMETAKSFNISNPDAAVALAAKSLPMAAGILATVFAMEAARRAAGSAVNVKFQPAFLLPVWPMPSVGCLGAISRRTSLTPNRGAELAISTAAIAAGLVMSLSLMALGYALGPDPDGIVNLNFQLLPLILKLVLKPVLSLTVISSSPFVDPVNIAQVNPVFIGGVIGLIITALNLLPFGRSDGGIIIRNALGARPGSYVGIVVIVLLIFGSLSPMESAAIYLSFTSVQLLFNSGQEAPSRDGVSEPDEGAKLVGLGLVLLGCLLVVPGDLFKI